MLLWYTDEMKKSATKSGHFFLQEFESLKQIIRRAVNAWNVEIRATRFEKFRDFIHECETRVLR